MDTSGPGVHSAFCCRTMARRCILRRGMSADCTSAAATRGTRIPRRRSRSSKPPSNARRWRCWKSRSSATSRSISRRIYTTIWPRPNGTTGASTCRMRPDLAVHDVIAMWQERILSQLLSSLTLERLHDSELRVPADQDAFTTAELIERLTKAMFAETEKLAPGDYTNRKPAISSLRRNLQRLYLKRLIATGAGRGRRSRKTARRSPMRNSACSTDASANCSRRGMSSWTLIAWRT